MKKNNAGRRLEKGHYLRIGIDALLALLPILKRRTGNIQILRQLTMAGELLLQQVKGGQMGGDFFACPVFLSIVFNYNLPRKRAPIQPQWPKRGSKPRIDIVLVPAVYNRKGLLGDFTVCYVDPTTREVVVYQVEREDMEDLKEYEKMMREVEGEWLVI